MVYKKKYIKTASHGRDRKILEQKARLNFPQSKTNYREGRLSDLLK